MAIQAKFISEERAIRLDTKVLNAVRNNPEIPRAIYAEGKNTVYLLNQILYERLMNVMERSIPMPQEPEEKEIHPSCWNSTFPSHPVIMNPVTRTPSVFDASE